MQSRTTLMLAVTRHAWLSNAAANVPEHAAAPADAPAGITPPSVLKALRRQLTPLERRSRETVSLLATEVIICQSGCLSHDAYWRVQEYCRRHGKRCLLLEPREGSSLLLLPESSAL